MEQRQYKFRAWDKKHNCFTMYPFVLDNKGNVFREYVGGGKVEKHYIVQQWTGLNDVNGKPIFDGDIIKANFGDERYQESIFVVEWDDENAAFSFEGGSPKTDAENYFEIIGDILTTLELLTKE